MGVDVCLVQPQKIVGGQFTAQGLPASDDGDLLKQTASYSTVDGEEFAISKNQRWFRVRQRQLQPVDGKPQQNPGGAWVCPFTTTPAVAATAMNERLIPFLQSGKLKLIPDSEPMEVLVESPAGERQQVKGAKFQSKDAQQFTITASVTLEATEFGDLLELANLPSRVGQESRNDTGEAILPTQAIPACQQSFTFNVIVERAAGQGKKMAAPAGYDQEPWLDPQDFTEDYWTQQSRALAKTRFSFHRLAFFATGGCGGNRSTKEWSALAMSR